MAIHIESGKNNLDLGVDRTSKVQLMPFRIKADCEAKVSQFFEPCVTLEQSSGCYKGSFRGYPLIGEKIELPEGYLGVILDEKIKPVTDKADRRFFVRGNFKSVLYWNWDKTPSKNDALVKTLSDWIDIAEALHSPIIEE